LCLPCALDVAVEPVETEYLLLLSRDLGSIDARATGILRSELEEISRMPNALREKV